MKPFNLSKKDLVIYILSFLITLMISDIIHESGHAFFGVVVGMWKVACDELSRVEFGRRKMDEAIF